MRLHVTAVLATSLLALTGCGGNASPERAARTTPSQTVTTPATAGAPTDLDGTYAVSWTVEELTEALGGDGNPDSARLAEGNAGTIRLELDSGRYDLVFEDIGGDSCPGTYVLDGDRIVMTGTSDPTQWDCGADSLGSKQADASWSVDEAGLTLTEWKLPMSGGPMYFNEVLLGGKPLARVKN